MPENYENSNAETYSFHLFKLFEPDAKIDVVPPPQSWGVHTSDIADYSHINIVVSRVTVTNPEGLLGETSRLQLDSQGNPITTTYTPQRDIDFYEV